MAKKGDFELAVKADLNTAKDAVDEILKGMGFTISYSNATEAIAQRGSGLASYALGPFAGKNNVAVKFGLSYSEDGGQTMVAISDEGSGLGKTLTLTGGTTKKVLQDVGDTLRDGLGRKGLV